MNFNKYSFIIFINCKYLNERSDKPLITIVLMVLIKHMIVLYLEIQYLLDVYKTIIEAFYYHTDKGRTKVKHQDIYLMSYITAFISKCLSSVHFQQSPHTLLEVL